VTLRRRLTLLSALAVALAVVLASVIVYALVRDRLRDQIDDTLRERAAAATVFIGGRLFSPGDGGVLPAPRPHGLPPREAPRGEGFELPPPPLGDFVPRGQLIDANGAVEPAPGGAVPVTEEARQVAAGERGSFFSEVSVEGSELRVLTVPAGPDRALQVARPLDEVNDTLSDLVLILALVSGGGIALAAGLGMLVARTSLAPAAAVSAAAEDVARTRDLTRRIEEPGSDELGRLAASFNEMMAALERSVGAQHRLVADASHELRTPLATLRTNIETLAREDQLDEAERRRVVADLAAELEDLSGLVADLVELAREPSDAPAISEDVRLDELASAAVERARRRARGLHFETSLEPSVVSGDPARLDRAIWNLLDNAIKWSPEGGTVEVEVTGGRLAVRDHGPGFSREDLPRAFDRFHRADDARGTPGSGLGLAIVRRITEEHGGRAQAENATGGGATVTVELPAAGSPPEREQALGTS
jgi:two-component system sensor histidine kinase MprB